MNRQILVLLLTAALLAACGEAQRERESTSVDVPAQTAPPRHAAAVDVAAETDGLAPNTQPVSGQKPELILSEEVSKAELERQMVRTASVNFTAADVVKTALAIEKLVVQEHGFIEQKDIVFNVNEVQKQNIADGQIKVFEKVLPTAVMTVRVPSDKAASFVNQLLPLMQFLNQQQYTAKRYELQLLEEKISQSNTVPSEIKNKQLTEIAKLTELEVQDRVKYSTIVINMNQPMLVHNRIEVDLHEVARLNGDGFWTRTWQGIQSGWHFMLNLLVGLITIWPVYVVGAVGFWVYRYANRVYQKHLNKPSAPEKTE